MCNSQINMTILPCNTRLQTIKKEKKRKKNKRKKEREREKKHLQPVRDGHMLGHTSSNLFQENSCWPVTSSHYRLAGTGTDILRSCCSDRKKSPLPRSNFTCQASACT